MAKEKTREDKKKEFIAGYEYHRDEYKKGTGEYDNLINSAKKARGREKWIRENPQEARESYELYIKGNRDLPRLTGMALAQADSLVDAAVNKNDLEALEYSVAKYNFAIRTSEDEGDMPLANSIYRRANKQLKRFKNKNHRYQESEVLGIEAELHDPSKSRKSLETTISATAAIIGILGGLFFLSSNITGNVIGNLTNSTSNWIGAELFIFGLISAFTYFRKR